VVVKAMGVDYGREAGKWKMENQPLVQFAAKPAVFPFSIRSFPAIFIT
jgi:hypothetical protein